jgi:hypothetical protein
MRKVLCLDGPSAGTVVETDRMNFVGADLSGLMKNHLDYEFGKISTYYVRTLKTCTYHVWSLVLFGRTLWVATASLDEKDNNNAAWDMLVTGLAREVAQNGG